MAVAPAGDGLTLGAAQPARRGAAPEAGQIAVEIDPPGLAPWAKVRIVERTALPVDFVITGYIDRIKIDEIEICGRTGERIEAKIAAGARKLSLNRFSIHPAGAPCPAPTPAAQ